MVLLPWSLTVLNDHLSFNGLLSFSSSLLQLHRARVSLRLWLATWLLFWRVQISHHLHLLELCHSRWYQMRWEKLFQGQRNFSGPRCKRKTHRTTTTTSVFGEKVGKNPHNCFFAVVSRKCTLEFGIGMWAMIVKESKFHLHPFSIRIWHV